MKQIVLITDGCSNVGISPVIAATQAREEGITVNVIGVIDQGDIGEWGAREIQEIASAGGGMCRISTTSQLAQTMQMMTRKTVLSTVQQVVQQELKAITGNGAIGQLPPGERSRVVQVMEEVAETCDLQVAVLIDASASMRPKLKAVEEALRDLMMSLQARIGVSEMAVFHFPSATPGNSEDAQLDVGWTKELAKIKNMFYKLNMKGTTPTGPAILRVVRYMTQDNLRPARNESADKPTTADMRAILSSGNSEEGILSDYVV